MPEFKLISTREEIVLSKEWANSAKFNSKERVVDAEGKTVASDYEGRQYRLIEKRERTLSAPERIGRGFLGVIAVICTLCLALFSKSVRNLFTKPKINVRFAILREQTKFKFEQDKIIYIIEPKLLISGGPELNFALVDVDGKEKLVAVTKAQNDKEYRTYEGSALEALLKLAQGDRNNKSPVGDLLNHPNNSIVTEEEFFTFILEKDQNGTPRICTLNSASTLEVLNIIIEKKIPINLSDKTPNNETLFSLWAGKGNAKITRIMLELDPSVIGQTQGKIKSAFVVAALNRSEEEAEILIGAMEKENIVLSEEEIWIKRAFKDDCNFADNEFLPLDQDLQIKVFFVANAFANENMVKKLKQLGMNNEPLFFWPGLDIFACNMDIVEARAVMENFLKDLKNEGLLITEEEFNKLDEKKYIPKVDQIGRIQGKNFIEKLTKENKLQHIKVPKKIAVINKGLENVSFRMTKNFELVPKEDQLKVYAERVEPLERTLSLQEAIEFMIILEKTGYSDIRRENFIFAEDGIYFIDTEFTDFSPNKPDFKAIKTIQFFLSDPKDKEKFLAEYEKRKEAYENAKETRDAQEEKYHKAFVNPLTNLTYGYRRQEFTFQLSSL